jgi:hypothetical protein
VSAGVGGKTIAEAKRNMSFAEARQWVAYVRKRGPLNTSRHIEWGFSLLASLICTGNKITIAGQKPTQKTFMPYSYPAESGGDVEGSITDVFNLFKRLKKNGQ